MIKFRLLIVFLFISLSGFAFAQSGEEILTLRVEPYSNYWPENENMVILIQAEIAPEWHINANQTLDEFTIPTEVNLEESPDFELLKIDYPTGEMKRFAFSDLPIPVYSGKINIFLTLKGRALQVGKEVRLQGSLYYQGCNNQFCLPPAEKSFSLQIPVVASNSGVIYSTNPAFASFLEKQSQTTATRTESGETLFEGKGLLLTLILIFLGGLALNLTPCVYPLIPITISYFGGQAAGKGKAFLLAALYVLGIALTYSILGTLAAMTGGMFGTALTNPVVLVIIALILMALALSMFGLYEFRMPGFMMQLAGGSRSGYTGAFLMGLTMGIVAAPCIGPFIIGLLTYVATRGNALIGFIYFFILSLGLGLPYLLLAGFSARITSLPRSGEWMVGVRNIFGFVLLGMAIYFINPILPAQISHYLLPVFMIFAGIYLSTFDRKGSSSRGFVTLRNLLAALILIVAGWMLKPETSSAMEMNWEVFSEKAFQQAIQENKPIIIDFYADWCIPCKELDHKTFTDPRIIELSSSFRLFKVDITTENEDTRTLTEKYQIKGVPTLIFYNQKGEQLEELTLHGFENPDEFLKRMQRALTD